MLKDIGKIHRLDINDAQKPTTDSPKRKLVIMCSSYDIKGL